MRAQIDWQVKALQNEKGGIVIDDNDRQDQVTLNRLDELLIPRKTNQQVRVDAITRAAARRRQSPQIVQEEIVQQIRIERIKQAQGKENWISNLKIYLTGDVSTITSADAKNVTGSRRIMSSIRTSCCSFVPDRPQSQNIAWSWDGW